MIEDYNNVKQNQLPQYLTLEAHPKPFNTLFLSSDLVFKYLHFLSELTRNQWKKKFREANKIVIE